jgi:sugar phosphate isomerase/epimerase
MTDTHTLTRRALIAAAAITCATRGVAAQAGSMTLALHQNTSARIGYREALEGWARAGIKQVELTSNSLDGFLKSDTLAAARRVLDDNALTPVCASHGVNGLYEPNPNRASALDEFKRRCEQFAQLKVPKIYQAALGAPKVSAADYSAIAANLRELGTIADQHGLDCLVELYRASSYISTLPTLLKVTRDAAHPRVKPLFDFYHFWSGMSKLEDLDAVKPGELGHVHFQDIPDTPRELLDLTTRAIPGDGIAPLAAILKKLVEKNYRGPLSVELFAARFQQGDPFEIAQEIKKKSEAVMRAAAVL